MEKIFKIDSEIYNENILKQAIFDFSDVGEISLVGNDIIVYGDNEDEINEVFGELMNYFIGLFSQ